MIIEWLVEVSAAFNVFLAGLFPEWEPPAELTEGGAVGDFVGSITPFLGGLDYWVNLALSGAIIAIVLSAYVVGATYKLIRVLISHVPLFGGRG